MKHSYRAHGLVISSEVELALPPGPPASDTPDLVLRWGAQRPIPADHPPGDRLAGLSGPDSRVYYSLGGS